MYTSFAIQLLTRLYEDAYKLIRKQIHLHVRCIQHVYVFSLFYKHDYVATFNCLNVLNCNAIQVYRTCVRSSKEEFQDTPPELQVPAEPCTTDLQHCHYTFDFAQNVALPHHARQMGPMYFVTARKVSGTKLC